MVEKIKSSLDNPNQLEKLYRENKTAFKKDFNNLYPVIKENTIAQIWNERLNFESDEISWGTKNELVFVIIASVLAGFITKLPHFFGFTEDFFYQRNIAFVVFPLLAAYFAWKQNVSTKKIVVVSIAILVSVLYINFLPANNLSDTLILACIHLPLFLWAVLGFTYLGDEVKNNNRRLDFLRYNGDLVVMTAIILLAGALFTALTINLFRLIDIPIEEFYFRNIGIWGLAAAPIVGTYLVQTNPQLVNKVSPIIAKIFTPLVLVTLIVYLVAVIYTGKDPYNDREFLLIFNVLLIGVMAIIFFSIAESSKTSGSKITTVMLFTLSIVTIVVNGIALSAIIFRISEWGITPNRLAVLGSNVLILLNLLYMSYNLFKTLKDTKKIEGVGNSIAFFLPVYSLWTMIVTFVLPILFNFR
jgi:hypothetical protein